MNTHQQILALLVEQNVPFRTLHHKETFTSEESAEVRGEPLEIGAKAIVMKVGDRFRLFVISAALRIDAGKVRSFFHVKKTRFASRDELIARTGLVPGAVPPFGKPILDLEDFVDTSIAGNERVAFNAGSLTDSIILSSKDYLRLASPVVFDFAQAPASHP